MQLFSKKQPDKKQVDSSDLKDTLLEMMSMLDDMRKDVDTLSRRLDRLNDTVVEHFEGMEDLGEINKLS
jgi:hypothetical protein